MPCVCIGLPEVWLLQKIIPSILLLGVEHPQICVDSSAIEMAEQGWAHHYIVRQTEAPFGQLSKTHIGLGNPETINMCSSRCFHVWQTCNCCHRRWMAWESQDGFLSRAQMGGDRCRKECRVWQTCKFQIVVVQDEVFKKGIEPGHGEEETNRGDCFVTSLCRPLTEVPPHTPTNSKSLLDGTLFQIQDQKQIFSCQPVLCSMSLQNLPNSSNQPLLLVFQVNVDLGFRELLQHLQVDGWSKWKLN